MEPEIRHPRVEEFEDLMRYLERAFGHSKGFFERVYPQLYQPTEEAMSWAYVIVEDGKILSHVGLYPIETVTAGVRLSVGGIGAVSTAPEARGQGYMTRLLYHIVDEMRRIGYPVSWLGGDRQRYNVFGWEMTSPEYELIFSRRSLGWQDVEPVQIEEVFPEEALSVIRRFQTAPASHPVRPRLETQIRKANLRFWVAENGYAILSGQSRDHIRILELVSTTGDEIGMIRAMLDFNFGDRATWSLSMWDKTRLGRLMPYAGYWRSGNSDMYRINDLTDLMTVSQGALAGRAAAVRDFAVAVGVKEHDRTAVTTIRVTDGVLSVRPGNHADTYVELSPVETARLFLGGPPIAGEGALPAPLVALLPVPVYVFPFDHV